MPDRSPLRVLILGGTSEASALVAALADRPDIALILSLAGRTRAPVVPVPTRVGGFGGVDGLRAFIDAERIDLVVDATHPFATRISDNAARAAYLRRCPTIRIARPAWAPRLGDSWTEVEDMAAAATWLGMRPRRVFLTIGRSQLAAFAATPHHTYLVRTVETVPEALLPPSTVFIQGRGPFHADEEERLMREHQIEVLVTKNSGGSAAAPKLDAARRLGVPVVLIRRPTMQDGVGLEEAIAMITAHGASGVHGASAKRGV